MLCEKKHQFGSQFNQIKLQLSAKKDVLHLENHSQDCRYDAWTCYDFRSNRSCFSRISRWTVMFLGCTFANPSYRHRMRFRMESGELFLYDSHCRTISRSHEVQLGRRIIKKHFQFKQIKTKRCRFSALNSRLLSSRIEHSFYCLPIKTIEIDCFARRVTQRTCWQSATCIWNVKCVRECDISNDSKLRIKINVKSMLTT